MHVYDLVVVWIYPEGFLFQFGPIKISSCLGVSSSVSVISYFVLSLVHFLCLDLSLLLCFLFLTLSASSFPVFSPLPFSQPLHITISPQPLPSAPLFLLSCLSLSAFLSPLDSTEETRSQMFTLLSFVTNGSVQRKALERTRRARRSKNSQEKTTFP